MKTFITNLKRLAVCMFIMILLSAGCGDDEVNVGYYYIDIPGYEVSDYEQMLNSNNPEEQYNSLAYLSFNFEDLSVLKYDSLKGTGQYDTALRIYNKALELTSSPNSWVSSAAFHLLDGFDYEEGLASYRKQLLQNRNPSINVQMEIFAQTRGDSTSDFALLKEKILFLKKQPSWLLNKSAYALMINGDSLMMNEVMKEYTTSTNPVDKLLLLQALNMNMNEAVFYFLTRVWDTTKDERIRNKIINYFPYARRKQPVLNWYAGHIDVLKKQMNYFVGSSFADSESESFLSDLIVLALEKGWSPNEIKVDYEKNRFYNTPKLYYYLYSNKYDDVHPDSILLKQSTNNKRVEKALLQHPVWSKEWVAYEQKYRTYPLPPTLIMAHRQLTETYVKQTRILMQQYGIDTSHYLELLKSVTNVSDRFYKERLEQ
jgi:hypothetical protein